MGLTNIGWILSFTLLSNLCFALKQKINACEGLTSVDQGPFTLEGRTAYQTIDGSIDQISNYASVQDPKESGTAWWKVDLGFRRTIVNLTILWADLAISDPFRLRTIKRRYGYEIHVSNFGELDKTKSTLCYRDDGSSRPAKAIVYITNCTMPSRYIHIYNTRPSNITDASDWPNLEITEVQAYIEKGEAGSCEPGKFGRSCSLSCHCNGSVVCDTNGDCPNDCDPQWTGPTCQLHLENVAQGKEASQGPQTKGSHEAEYAVDGVTNQKNNYSHAKGGDVNSTTWWQVNLGGVQKIHTIQVLFAETDSYEKKLRGFSIKVSNSSEPSADGDLCYEDHSGSNTPPTTINLSNCSYGSYVRLYNSRYDTLNQTVYSKWPHLQITEVQVIAETDCAAGSYGPQCQSVCGRCKNSTCARDDGSCGECTTGWYGSDCNQECSSSCSAAGCVKDTGYCVEDCGLAGDCEQGCERQTGKCNSCPLNKHGHFCEKGCSSNCDTANCPGRICDRDTGHCLCGCKEKKFGDACDQRCPSNCIMCQNYSSCSSCEKQSWGVRCEKSCSIDCSNQECEKLTGKCHGCTGDSKYGDMCAETCPSDCKGDTCHQNGTCQQGCKDLSLYGGQCDKPCSDFFPSCKECQQSHSGSVECMLCKDGKYGKSCEQDCPLNCAECKDASTCTQCKVRFTGQTCDTVCSVPDCSICAVNGTCDVCLPGKYGRNCEFECSDCKTCTLDETVSKKHTCLTCKEGEYLFIRERQTLCLSCETNCFACVSGDNCTSCKDGYHGKTCGFECPDTCQSCLSDTDCTSCKTGWTGSACQCNLKNCITDIDQSKWCAASGTCLKGCRKGYFGENCDSKCVGNCTECMQNEGKCSECAAGFYGITCADKCSSNCAEKDFDDISICDFYDGSCSGCEYGWYGPKCEKPCNPNCQTLDGNKGCNQNDGTCEKCGGNKYGLHCELDCPHNCYSRTNESNCRKGNGTCVGCVDGSYGVYCNMSCSDNCKTSCEQSEGDCDECKSGYYGRFCKQRCSSNCGRGKESKMIVCNRFTGECLFCKEGYHGEICNFECSTNCSIGSQKPNCEKADGHCKACIPGRHGHLCDGKCNKNCGIAEGDNGNVGLCNRTTSLCLHGCAKGWYNFTCLERCNSKCRGETCNRDDGKCSDGCVSGFKGEYCSLLVPEDPSTAGVVGGVIGAVLLVIIVLVILFFVRRWYRQKPVRKGNNTKVHKRAVKNGITSDEIIPLYANVNGANSLPLPARNATKATVEEEIAGDDDDSTPLMGSDHKASDYYNLSSQIPVAGFADYVHGRQAANMDWYKADFATLPRGLLKNCLVAVSPANRGKCRYKNLYPYDDSRVILEPDGNEKTDFINASYIHGYQKKEAFIAAQGPMEQNVNDFWRMIWQMDCGKIMMLTNLYEDCKIKCIKYWPDEKETECYGNLDIEIAGEEVFSDYTLRHLKATHKKTREEKDFKHFHFTAWPDRGVPENAGSMLHFRDKVNEADGVPDGPILVHCSAGIGRTGTFIVIDYLLRQAKAESHIDVFRTVTDMRYQRANFVQTDIQYEFVHKALVEALTTKEMEISAAEFCRYYWSLLEDRSEYSNQTKLQEQYETLNEMSATLDEACFTSGHLPENIGKNRYPDIVPVDTYRAYLSTPVKGSNEYINAVFLPTCLNKSAFLLTQMPLPHTVTDFWRLVYDQHVSTLVMMNNISDDDDDETVGEYWPSEDSTYGPFKIELLSCENHDHYSIMAMKLTYISSSRQDSMTVRQYRFESWPDSDPLPTSSKALVSLTDAVQQSPKTYKDESVIVHCMNGNDRSGLFCTISAIMAKLRTQQKVNIPQTILQLRRRRPQLIPNLEQYDFCHRAVSEYLDDTQIYSNVM